LYDVLDGAIRLNLDYFDGVIKEKIRSGHFHRSPKEVSVLLFYISRKLDKKGVSDGLVQENETLLRKELLPCLKNMQFHNLSIH